MSLTKTGFVFVISVFFLSTIALTTVIGDFYNESTGLETTNINNTNFFGDLFNNFITGFSIIPWWINSIVYGSIIVTGLFIILGSLPTFSGGG